MLPFPFKQATLGKMPVFDLHCDTLDRLVLCNSSLYPNFAEQNAAEGIVPNRMRSLFDNDAHVSLSKMAAYRWAQCFAVFIPDGLGADNAWLLYKRVTGFFREQCKMYPYSIASVRNPTDIATALATDKCAALLTVEGASFFTDSLAPLDQLELDGVRMISLTWNAQNALASGNETHEGFSAFGKEVVKGLESRRIVVDVSHLNDEGFTELLGFARRPFAASHSNSRAICDHPRNLTDEQFRAIVDREGIVGLNFCNEFLTTEKRDATPEDFIRHISHWLDLGGERAIALGSDYDGCDVPAWLRPADRIQVLFAEVARVFGEGIAHKLFFTNATEFFNRSVT